MLNGNGIEHGDGLLGSELPTHDPRKYESGQGAVTNNTDLLIVIGVTLRVRQPLLEKMSSWLADMA